MLLLLLTTRFEPNPPHGPSDATKLKEDDLQPYKSIATKYTLINKNPNNMNHEIWPTNATNTRILLEYLKNKQNQRRHVLKLCQSNLLAQLWWQFSWRHHLLCKCRLHLLKKIKTSLTFLNLQKKREIFKSIIQVEVNRKGYRFWFLNRYLVGSFGFQINRTYVSDQNDFKNLNYGSGVLCP